MHKVQWEEREKGQNESSSFSPPFELYEASVEAERALRLLARHVLKLRTFLRSVRTYVLKTSMKSAC